jgi:hypothetical protein
MCIYVEHTVDVHFIRRQRRPELRDAHLQHSAGGDGGAHDDALVAAQRHVFANVIVLKRSLRRQVHAVL